MKKNIVLASLLVVSMLAEAQIRVKEPLTKQPKLTPTQQLRIDSTGMTKTVSVMPSWITSPLCPWVKTRGDNDFANNEVRVSVNIHFVYNMRYGDSILKANIVLTGEENGGDGTSVRGEWQRVVYKAPQGWKIKNIRSDTNSLATYFTFNANPREKFMSGIGVCPVRMYYPANFGYRVPMPTVRDIRIAVHRKDENDFDTNETSCSCGFRIERIEFKYLYVTLEKI
jgi:hypothetical protein